MSYVNEVLLLWSDSIDELDKDDLLWSQAPDTDPVFAVKCNDQFEPAADSELILYTDLPALRQAIADCREAGAASWGPLLWVARKRRERLWARKELRVPVDLYGLFQTAAQTLHTGRPEAAAEAGSG